AAPPPLTLFFFFFSSRRRHTRWPRDWSSDVCSSDLYLRLGARAVTRVRLVEDFQPEYACRFEPLIQPEIPKQGTPPRRPGKAQRSEERRVGKECRSRRWTDHEKKKIKSGRREEREKH